MKTAYHTMWTKGLNSLDKPAILCLYCANNLMCMQGGIQVIRDHEYDNIMLRLKNLNLKFKALTGNGLDPILSRHWSHVSRSWNWQTGYTGDYISIIVLSTCTIYTVSMKKKGVDELWMNSPTVFPTVFTWFPGRRKMCLHDIYLI
jgi:hypothetical protein